MLGTWYFETPKLHWW